MPASLLIAEDDPTLRRLLTYHLGRYYHVRTASDGAEAIAALLEERPDLIISDVIMPGRSGLDVHAALLEAEADTDARADVPFIFLSAIAGAEKCEEVMRPGLDVFVAKPFDLREVERLVERMLSERGATAREG